MLSFDTALTNALKNRNTTAFWVLKLYYNDESAFIGISDRHRQDGTDIYYGIVTSWGDLRQSLDFFNFTTSIGNIVVNLVNTEKSIQGGRFSDLFSNYNFANRKWELFLNTNETTTLDTAARMIGIGTISGNIKYDENNVSLDLVDSSGIYHKRIPKNTVAIGTYANAPKNNINKPIPAFWGDCHDKTDIGTIPTSGANFDRHFTKGKFPAIIVDEWNETNARTEALVDSVAVHTLDTENVYMSIADRYGACNSSNVTIDAANYKITALGTDWRVYVSPKSHSTYSGGTNYANAFDEDFSTTGYQLVRLGNGATSVGFRVGKLPNLGTLTAVKALLGFGNFTGSAPNVNFKLSSAAGAGGSIIGTITWDGGDQEVTMTSIWGTGDQASWNIEEVFFLTLDNTGGSGSMNVYIDEIGLEFQIEPSQTFEHDMSYVEEVTGSRYVSEKYDKSGSAGDRIETTKRIIRNKTLTSPATVDYLYFSGKGRKYGAWIDTVNSEDRTDENGDAADPGYAAGAFIENPVYIIEDILRTELGLDSSTTGIDIDIESFDYSGNTTDGFVGDTYNDAVGDIEFAFSQYKFIDSQDLINKICRQICAWVFISGDGKFKIKSLKHTDDYSSSDQTVDFRDITLNSISKTALNNVRNDITVNYNFDYKKNQNLSNVNTASSTSKGTTVNGYNISGGLNLEIDADGIIDSTTATKLAAAYLAFFKDQKDTVDFTSVSPKYNHLEIGDIIDFSNWDAGLKIYGSAMSGYFIISDITKRVNGCSIKAIKVS